MPLSHPIGPPPADSALRARDEVLFGHWLRGVEPSDETVAWRVDSILKRIGVRCRRKRQRGPGRQGFDVVAATRALRSVLDKVLAEERRRGVR